jgi:squalene-hopene/tetraprenyl-beta-curcumene cyclase
MKPICFFSICLGLFLSAFYVYGAPKVEETVEHGNHLSLRNEVGRAIERGVKWLATEQNATSGLWGGEEYPAITGLSLRAILGDPARKNGDKYSAALDKGYSFILSKTQSDGGIYGKGLASYNTSICLMALLQRKKPEYKPVILKARNFLINQQHDFDSRGKNDNVFDGGIGYGARWAHSDLSNTHLAMEALFYTKKMIETEEGDKLDLDWKAAIAFVEKCQNLPGNNKEKWVSEDPSDRGGFVYFPGSSMAGERKLAGGKVALRSYGSMSYAGMLSFIYAEMDPKDDRVKAVRDWLSQNYSVKENPGLGPQGMFYYFHTMAKALSLSGSDKIKAQDGSLHDWRHELARKLFNLQNQKGYWLNENGRWWERDPVLVTSYALLTLERIYYSL